MQNMLVQEATGAKQISKMSKISGVSPHTYESDNWEKWISQMKAT